MTSLDVLAVGDHSVDLYVEQGKRFPGGNALNVAIHAARLGARAGYVGQLGDDQFSEEVLGALVAEGVDVAAVRRVPGPATTAEVFLSNGDRHFGRWELGAGRLQLTSAEAARLPRARIVHTGDASGLDHVLAALHGRGTLSYDFSDQPWEQVQDLLPHVDIATFSASHLTEWEVRSRADDVLGRGPRVVLMTSGPAGAFVATPESSHWEPGRQINVVDTLGAGDSFIAAYLARHVAGDAPALAVKAAVEYSARVCQHMGSFGYSADLLGSHAGPAVTPLDGGSAARASV